MKPEELRSTCSDTEQAANCYWLVTHCKACPSCRSPIQKNEGCNHIKCSKCKFDFCWVCLDAWKKHSSTTGGYFRCNRYDAVSKADEKQGSLITQATQRNKILQVTSFQRVASILPGLHYWVLLGFPGFSWVLLGFTWFYWVLLGFPGFYLVLLGFTGFYWVYSVLLGFDWVYSF